MLISVSLMMSLQKMMKFHHIIYWGNFGETDAFPIISQRGNGNFHFPSIFHRNLSISLKFPPKNYGDILTFFAVCYKSNFSADLRDCSLFRKGLVRQRN